MELEAEQLQRQNTVELDPLSTAEIYYGQSHKNKAGSRVRTYSTVCLFLDLK
jgi:hypothetical protein